MLGSLVIIFPAPHDGGVISLRSCNHEWTFDRNREMAAAAHTPSVGYIVSLKNIEHEVAPIISGYRVTLTYNLYAEADDGSALQASAKDRALNPFCPLANERAFRNALSALIDNPEFLAEGGTLGFGLRHVYPNNERLSNIYGLLKGSDAVVYRIARALGFEPVLYLYYEVEWGDLSEGGFMKYPLDLDCDPEDGDDIISLMRADGGIIVCKCLEWHNRDGLYPQARPEKVEWVTPKTTFNRCESRYILRDNATFLLEAQYGDLCLVVRIGKVGERWTYPTVAQLDKEWEKEHEGGMAMGVRDEIMDRLR